MAIWAGLKYVGKVLWLGDKAVIAGIPRSVTYLYFGAKWDRLRKLGNSSFSKLTLLLPIVGYLILFNDEIISNLELSAEYVGQSILVTFLADGSLSDEMLGYLSNSMRLYCLYFGLLAIALATLLYQFYCPEIIKDFSSPGEYVRSEGAIVSDNAFGEMLRGRVQTHASYPLQEIIPSKHIGAVSWRLIEGIERSVENLEREILGRIEHEQKDMRNNWDYHLYQTREREVAQIITAEGEKDYWETEFWVQESEVIKRAFMQLASSWDELKAEGKEPFMADEFRELNEKGIRPRTIAFMLYWIGFIVVAVPSLDTFISIIVKIVT